MVRASALFSVPRLRISSRVWLSSALWTAGGGLYAGCTGAETIEQMPTSQTQSPSATATDSGQDGGDTEAETVEPTQGNPSDPVDPSNPRETESDTLESGTTADTEGATESDTEGDTDSGTIDPVSCGRGGLDLTPQGVVAASSVFDPEFPAELAVDSSRTTSWFSAGPGRDGTSTFTWTAPATVCMTTLEFAGNGMHEQEEFRQNFGFEMLTVRVFDADNGLVFEQSVELPGTPDPQQSIDLGGIEGVLIAMEMSGHEDPICGGFSELAVLGS